MIAARHSAGDDEVMSICMSQFGRRIVLGVEKYGPAPLGVGIHTHAESNPVISNPDLSDLICASFHVSHTTKSTFADAVRLSIACGADPFMWTTVDLLPRCPRLGSKGLS